MDGGAWRAAVHGVAKSQTRLNGFTFTFHFHALEKEMATHSSILAWRIPETEEPSRLLSLGSHRVVHGWSNLAAAVSCATLFIGTATSLLPLCPKPWQPLMSSQSVILSFQKRYRNRITMCNCEIDFFFFAQLIPLRSKGLHVHGVFLFCCWVVIYGIMYSVCLTIQCWRTFGFFPVLGYYQHCCTLMYRFWCEITSFLYYKCQSKWIAA